MKADAGFVAGVVVPVLGVELTELSKPSDGRCCMYVLTNRRCSSGVG